MISVFKIVSKNALKVILTANLSKREDFPTPEFPIRRTLKR